MGQEDIEIDELVTKLRRGSIRLPEMQRQYVWKKPQVRDLLDSLYRGYPSGTILTWEIDEEKEIETRAFAVDQEDSKRRNFELLLDGQQRLTSLLAILEGKPVHVREQKRPIDILFNLEHPETVAEVTEVDEDEEAEDDTDFDGSIVNANQDEILKRFDHMAFAVSTKKLTNLPYWVSVTKVFRENSDRLILKEAGVTKMEDTRYDKYTKRLNKLRDIKKYKYRVHVLDSDKSYEEVTEIFVRVNSLGAKLRSSDLALAQITAKWKGALKIFQEFEDECANNGFDFDIGVHLKNLVAFATEQSRFRFVGNLSKKELKIAWEKAKKGMNYALNFLRVNAKIDSPVLLSSSFIAITLAKYGYLNRQITKKEAEQLHYWVLMANVKGRYSRGSTENYLDEDLAALQQGQNINVLLQHLEKQVGRLEVLASDLQNQNSRSRYFKMMFMAFREHGARDWLDHSLEISFKHVGSRHALEFHHIFPKAVLENALENMSKEEKSRKINDICNLAFISSDTNKWIGKRKPSVYLCELVNKFGEKEFMDELGKQCIPIEPELWKVEEYDNFLKERRKLVAERLNQFLGHENNE